MAYLINREHFVPFRVVISGTPVTGLTLGSFTKIFNRDLVTATETVSITEKGDGLYYATYTPTHAGFFYLQLTYTPGSGSPVVITDSIEIDDQASFAGLTNLISVTQDYHSTNYLVPAIASPENYVLNFYKSSDWQIGRRTSTYVANTTNLDGSGNWVTETLYMLPDTYHVVVQNNAGYFAVLVPFLVIS